MVALEEKYSTIFRSLVFSRDKMQAMLSRDTFAHYLEAIQGKEALDIRYAEDIARAMKEWAMEHGATHYCHWFQPWTGGSAEKHDSFLEWSQTGEAIERFTANALVMGEPDASSLPSGGLRNTYEARGYTSWDPSSPPFIWRNGAATILCIPSIFFSYTGEALDTKIPLLRSDVKIAGAVERLLGLLGERETRVHSTLGCEQEYFIIDRALAAKRRDLSVFDATVVGAAPAKGQEMEDHYFGVVQTRVLQFMERFEREALTLGIPVKTRHNEVAPSQHEVAPFFEQSSIAVDHNILLMEVMRKTARELDLTCLLHEKPFAGINGSGKHLNWSLATEDGINLFDPGETPQENRRFLLLVAAVLEAIHSHPALLRASIGSYANDKRLGGNEAPPGIISVYLGEALDALLSDLQKKGRGVQANRRTLDLGIPMIPELGKHDTDRNRTSPFAFTGNKFEFRAAGSSASPAFPLTVLNVIVAEALHSLCDEIESGRDPMEVLIASLDRSEKVRYLGDNYAAAWRREARRRQLPEIRSSDAAYGALLEESSRDAFAHVLSHTELSSIYEVLRSHYKKQKAIEERLLLEIAQSEILPAAFQHQKNLADAAVGAAQKSYLASYGALLTEAVELTQSCVRRRAQRNMARLRKVLDQLEQQTEHRLWPMPKYWELLFWAH